MNDGQGRPVYSIGAVSKMLGVPAATLRTWQERYGVVVPTRSESGHRLYSRDQVEHLRFIADQVAANLSPADAHRLLAERLAAGASLRTAPGPERRRTYILLAERDPFAAEFADFFLRTEGYEVALVTTAEDALLRSTEDRPHLAVVDLLISGGRGLDLCKQLAEQENVPVLAVSALDTSDAAIEAGASAFLLKPIEPLHLVSTVKDLLGRSAFLQPSAAQEEVSG